MNSSRWDARDFLRVFSEANDPVYRTRYEKIHLWYQPYADLFPEPLSDEDLAQLEVAARDFDMIWAPLRRSLFSQHLKLENAYRTRLEEEKLMKHILTTLMDK